MRSEIMGVRRTVGGLYVWNAYSRSASTGHQLKNVTFRKHIFTIFKDIEIMQAIWLNNL